MIRNLAWTADGERDLSELIRFIVDRNPLAAERLDLLIIEGAERLMPLPFAYRPGRISDTREAILHPNYILVYPVTDAQVRMLRVLHSRQRYP